MTLDAELYKDIRDYHSDRVTFSTGDGWASMLNPYKRNQDALFVAEPGEDLIVAAVLDGLGSYPDSGRVARDVAEWLEVCVMDGTVDAEKLAHDPEAYKSFFGELGDWTTGVDGSTTLALAALHRTSRQVGYLSIGDSRIYHIDGHKFRNQPSAKELFSGKNYDYEKTQHTVQLTKDEKQNDGITNSISTRNFHGVNQSGSKVLSPGDRILLATDGVFNNKDDPDGTFSEGEIGRFANPELSPLDALTNLVLREANCLDDRAAITIDA